MLTVAVWLGRQGIKYGHWSGLILLVSLLSVIAYIAHQEPTGGEFWWLIESFAIMLALVLAISFFREKRAERKDNRN
ncbi:hypothetical protein ACFOYY_01595 [Streptosporangium jomthongense]|uniref:Uncharacterized protein n=1 Tax=Streptosporangium jomthongense TaxID=1193683 RepID=A0ABV8ER20_9ACTN